MSLATPPPPALLPRQPHLFLSFLFLLMRTSHGASVHCAALRCDAVKAVDGSLQAHGNCQLSSSASQGTMHAHWCPRYSLAERLGGALSVFEMLAGCSA